ncbi:MAG: asparagine synthase C-terminal domain-containing protein [Thermoplasmata archaeon]|nr:asparagine synthase C-terminal domain-containing protein [Thermoplasmata archaeon]
MPSWAELGNLLAEVALRTAGDAPVSLLYSGGVDSSLVAHLIRTRGPLLVVVGTPGASDLDAAADGAARLGLPLRSRTLRVEEVVELRDRWQDELADLVEPARSVSLALAAALDSAPPGRVLCGQGADELFHGYAHFQGARGEAATQLAAKDWGRLVEEDWPRARRMASANHQDLRSPFLDAEFVQAVATIPSEEHVGGGEERKPILRAIARTLGLPAELADRPKKALQYGSGIAHQLRILDRADRSAAAVRLA